MDSDIMTVEEVADYLRVSSQTVCAWAEAGKIPSGKFGADWRFQRIAVQDWATSHLAAPNQPGSQLVASQFTRVLTPEHILILSDYISKQAALDALIDCLADSPHIHDRQELKQGIYYRESLMSTGIGLGVAVPHVRLESVSSITMAAAACPAGLADFESLDQEPVGLIFMVVAPAGQHTQHLKLLAALSVRFKDGRLRQALIGAPTPQAFHDILNSTDQPT